MTHGLERATARNDAELAATGMADGRELSRKIAAAIRALQVVYHPCARCTTRSASIADAGEFVCEGCKRPRGRSVAEARRLLDKAMAR